MKNRLTSEQESQLRSSLTFLHVKELQDLAEELIILDKTSKKMAIITCIVHYLKTGEVIKKPTIPAVRKLKKGYPIPWTPTL